MQSISDAHGDGRHRQTGRVLETDSTPSVKAA